MNSNKTYDYIFAGLGASGMSLLMRIIALPHFKGLRILLIDKGLKNTNDRTWCFWEENEGFFESIVTKSWSNLTFHSPDIDKELSISPYNYKMIRGIDFYNHCWTEIQKHDNIVFHQDEILELKDNIVSCKKQNFKATYIFNSAYFEINKKNNEHYLLQHFKGWYLKTENDVFEPHKPTLMDFRVHQDYGCTFVYVMPLNTKEALIEYTLFSPELLSQEEYDKELTTYVNEHLNLKNYVISEEEFGVIPMTNIKFQKSIGKHIINIGTAGGQTKASTGYTFTRIQKQCDQIIQNLESNRHPLHSSKNSKKHVFYDSVLLNVLDKGKYPAWKIFHDMFTKLPPHLVLDFLDDKTTLWEDLKIMWSVHTPTFLKSALQKLFS